jgi:hypothetical protein
MRSIASLKARIGLLLAAGAEGNERPSTVVLLPHNGRGPKDLEDGEPDGRSWPRARRTGKALIIGYRLEDGMPGPEAIRQLVDQSVQP